MANRIVPLGVQQYLEVESVIDTTTAQRNIGGRWFGEQLVRGDVFLGWCARVDTRAELEQYAAWFEVPVQETGTRVTPDGQTRASARTPNAPQAWQRGLPNVFCLGPDTHPARNEVTHRRCPEGIAWIEVGGTEAAMRAWLGEGTAELPLRYNNRPPGPVRGNRGHPRRNAHNTLPTSITRSVTRPRPCVHRRLARDPPLTNRRASWLGA